MNKRILMLTVDFPPHRDGVSSLSHHYARRLAERGDQVMVVAPYAGNTRRADQQLPYRVMRFPGYSWGPLRMVPFSLWALAAMLRWRPELLLPMNIGYGGIIAWLVSHLGRCRYLMFAYGLEFRKVRNHPWVRACYCRLYHGAIGVITISNYTATELAAFGVRRACMHLVRPGVDVVPPTQRPPVAAANTNMCIGTCGRLIHRKGHDLVLRAMPAILREFPAVTYRIAGDGPERPTLERLACQLGVADHVHFLGAVPQSQLAHYYESLTLFVMPGRDESDSGHVEGFGIVYLEAAIHGVPSVAARTGGVPEAVLDGTTGLLIPPEDAEALADAILQLLREPARRARLGRAAQERAVHEFAWDLQVDQVHNWLTTQEVGEKRPPHG